MIPIIALFIIGGISSDHLVEVTEIFASQKEKKDQRQRKNKKNIQSIWLTKSWGDRVESKVEVCKLPHLLHQDDVWYYLKVKFAYM